ncbi:hypothetical protein [Limoniibacter endophyticus]|uniref:hypothetical protein n=1 Tax=Limoniibacter endophyticus TaxID=1565040 RepID=UPI001FCEADFC|nr:hypothetical protein [Limoniibacter endophyticus]
MIGFIALFGATVQAFGHASDGGHLLILPTGYYMAAAALSVAASFLIFLIAPAKPLHREQEANRSDLSRFSATSALSFVFLIMLISAGYIGSRDPLSNPLPLMIWTVLWVGVTLVQGLAGDLWRFINPWRFPCWLIFHLFGKPRYRLPQWLGSWPALFQFIGFAWFELIDPAPTDPGRLANAVLIYFCVNLIAAVLFGYRDWMRRGEFLSAFYAILRTKTPRALSRTQTIFLICVLASVSFDGFSKTFFWLGHVGINPLDYPGRSAMMIINSVGMAGFALVMIALFYTMIAIGHALTGAKGSFADHMGTVAISLIPIALVYHFSHYLTSLLIEGQYALAALSDPFGLGWNLLGLRNLHVRAGLTSGHGPVWLVWNLQAFAITLGHVGAVYRAHLTVASLYETRLQRFRFELPLTTLMIFYTIFGLWLLATPAAG